MVILIMVMDKVKELEKYQVLIEDFGNLLKKVVKIVIVKSVIHKNKIYQCYNINNKNNKLNLLLI